MSRCRSGFELGFHRLTESSHHCKYVIPLSLGRKFDPAGQHNASVPPIFLSARASLQWIVPGIPESICSNCPTLKISYSATPAKCAANFDVAPAHRGGLPTIGVIPPGLGRTRRTMESSL